MNATPKTPEPDRDRSLSARELPSTAQSPAASFRLNQVLVPSDFSGQSRQALKAAVPLAQQYGARISLVHVMQPASFSTWDIVPGGEHYVNLNLEAVENQAGERLQTLMSTEVPRPLQGRTLVRRGDPGSEIVAAAAELRADLVAISTHGYTGVRRVLIGSVTERVVRHAGCPVLTVRRADAPGSAGEVAAHFHFLREGGAILVPTDFSKTSLQALDVAVPLALQFQARLILLTVIEPLPVAVGMESVVIAVPESVLETDASRTLGKVASRLVPSSVPVLTMVDRGRPFDVITRKAAEHDADLVVLTTHGHSGPDRFLLGSTAERVVRHATCPVFVLRQSSHSA